VEQRKAPQRKQEQSEPTEAAEDQIQTAEPIEETADPSKDQLRDLNIKQIKVLRKRNKKVLNKLAISKIEDNPNQNIAVMDDLYNDGLSEESEASSEESLDERQQTLLQDLIKNNRESSEDDFQDFDH
jgi:hypothetical protein